MMRNTYASFLFEKYNFLASFAFLFYKGGGGGAVCYVRLYISTRKCNLNTCVCPIGNLETLHSSHPISSQIYIK